MIEKKLFKVERYWEPEWGKSDKEWEKYYLCENKDKLISFLLNEYGSLVKYNTYDRGQQSIYIEEVEWEEI